MHHRLPALYVPPQKLEQSQNTRHRVHLPLIAQGRMPRVITSRGRPIGRYIHRIKCVIVNDEMSGNIAIERKRIVISVITNRRSVLDIRRLSVENHIRRISLKSCGMRLRPMTNAVVFARQPSTTVHRSVVGRIHVMSRRHRRPNIPRMLRRRQIE